MKCRYCGHELSLSFLDLGSAPPSNAYLSSEGCRMPETWLPLKLLACDQCWLVQTEDHVSSTALFDKDYAYFSSYSSSWLRHARQYVSDMISRFGLSQQSTVVEVAANDGYLLQYVKEAGIPCYGIEPTASTAHAARDKGLEVLEEFFGTSLAERLCNESRQADLIVANNVLAHVPDISDFVTGFSLLLKPNGVATFEFPHLLTMVQGNQFDTAYHEHYSYLSLTTVNTIFYSNGLGIFDVEALPTHGGSLRVYAQRLNSGKRACASRVASILEQERSAGMETQSFYLDFQYRANELKYELLLFLIQAKRAGLKLGAYGAAAKGNTLLNFAGIRPDLVPYVADKNPNKQGQFLPGSHIPVVTEEFLKQDKPDIILILPWNLREEISDQLGYAREWGARFATAIPNVETF